MAVETYEVLAVDRRSLPAMRELFEVFAKTGNSQWTAEVLAQHAFAKLIEPTFWLWCVVETGKTKPLGFVAAQIQRGNSGVEGFILAAYMNIDLPKAATMVMKAMLESWATQFGLTDIYARTRRGTENGLAEPRAWKAFGFEYDSTLLRWQRRPPLEVS